MFKRVLWSVMIVCVLAVSLAQAAEEDRKLRFVFKNADGKPIHITEMGCSSAPGLDPNAQRKRATAGWHGPWTEEMQADWVEGIYTICYSKPYIQAVEWWDLADAVSFWPYGGLLRGDLSPKPVYLRLKARIAEWSRVNG